MHRQGSLRPLSLNLFFCLFLFSSMYLFRLCFRLLVQDRVESAAARFSSSNSFFAISCYLAHLTVLY